MNYQKVVENIVDRLLEDNPDEEYQVHALSTYGKHLVLKTKNKAEAQFKLRALLSNDPEGRYEVSTKRKEKEDVVEDTQDDTPVEANPFKQVYHNAIDNLGKSLEGQRSLVLVRGVSGSGKSTFATHVAAKLGHVVHSTDDFFMQDGTYKFDASKLGQAHKWNETRTDQALEAGKNVVVANTFTQGWEMAPYDNMAKKHGAQVAVFNTVFPGKNVHGVPEAGLKRMRDRWEPREGEVILKPDGS